MRYLLSIYLLSLLASCGVYKNSFDCPPGKGIGCAPVGEVLDLIVEKDEGEDLFVHDQGTALLHRRKYEQSKISKHHPKVPQIFYLLKDDEGNLTLVKSDQDNI